MTGSNLSSESVVVDGKFFRVHAQKFLIKGVTYGPFAPDATGQTFGAAEMVVQDFKQLRELAANLLRVRQKISQLQELARTESSLVCFVDQIPCLLKLD